MPVTGQVITTQATRPHGGRLPSPAVVRSWLTATPDWDSRQREISNEAPVKLCCFCA